MTPSHHAWEQIGQSSVVSPMPKKPSFLPASVQAVGPVPSTPGVYATMGSGSLDGDPSGGGYYSPGPVRINAFTTTTEQAQVDRRSSGPLTAMIPDFADPHKGPAAAAPPEPLQPSGATGARGIVGAAANVIGSLFGHTQSQAQAQNEAQGSEGRDQPRVEGEQTDMFTYFEILDSMFGRIMLLHEQVNDV